MVPIQPRTKARGIETIPGLSSGNQWKSTDVSLIIDRLSVVPGAAGFPDTTGEKMISVTQLIRPPYMLQSAPRVLKRFQYSEYRIVGRFADAATAKASATRNAMFWPSARMPPR